MSPQQPPPLWGKDEISKFIDAARNNEFATFANLKGDIARLTDIDVSYRTAIDGLNHAHEWFAGLFVLRAHSNFLAACRLCWSGQIPETYALLRSCLENALYGLYLARNPTLQKLWLSRHDSPEAKRNVRDEFRVGALLDLVDEVDETVGSATRALYGRTIDLGAHPNERALMQTLKISESPKHIEFKSAYLEGDSEQLKLALKTTAQVGICVLSVFRSVYPERFDILGVTDSLHQVSKGL